MLSAAQIDAETDGRYAHGQWNIAVCGSASEHRHHTGISENNPFCPLLQLRHFLFVYLPHRRSVPDHLNIHSGILTLSILINNR